MSNSASSYPARRLGYYCQTPLYEIKGRDSMVPLDDPAIHTSHVVLATFHLNYTKDPPAGDKKIYLNDVIYDEGSNIPVWDQAMQLREKGIKIFGMIGGAGQPGTMFDEEYLGSSDPAVFNKGYDLLAAMIRDKALDGIDMDVETFAIGNRQIIKIIKRLRADFPHLLITMAPGGTELLNEGHLSGVHYQKLYKDIGDEIAWFHIQMYNGFGNLGLEDFQKYVKAGFPVEKLFMLMPGPSVVQGWLSAEELRTKFDEITHQFPNMGGGGCWDYFSAQLEDPGDPDPLEWATFLSNTLFPLQ